MDISEVPIPVHRARPSRRLAILDPRPRPRRQFIDVSGLSAQRIEDLRLTVAAYKDQERRQRIADAEAAKAAAR